jgi:uncharacterized protein
MRPSEALAMHREEVLAILAKYPVSNPRIFGSVAREEDKEGSDIDMVVDTNAILSYFELAKFEIELSQVIGCRVDLGIFKDLKPDVMTQVVRDMRPL